MNEDNIRVLIDVAARVGLKARSQSQQMLGYRQTRVAMFSDDELYRYALAVFWSDHPKRVLSIIGLNPSTADENVDDPTLKRCQGFAARHGYDGIVMLNLFAYRSTDPRALKSFSDPVGVCNDDALRMLTADRDVLCAWGVHGEIDDRDFAVLDLLHAEKRMKQLLCLGVTKRHRFPRHPLYLPSDTPLRPYAEADARSQGDGSR